jgi:hypothetical protein
MITVGRRYVYYREHAGGFDRLPCVVVAGPFYRNEPFARWEIEIDGHSGTRFVSSVSLVTPDDDAACLRRYEALRD